MHSERARRLSALKRLAKEGKWDQLYQRHVFYEFPHELETGFQLAFLRSFADPDMAKILQRSGSLAADPMLRAYRTRTFIEEIIHGAITDERAAAFVRRMNRIHGAFPITQEQLTYILCAFIVVPTRHVEHTGWRPVTAEEREAATRFYERLGRHMDIQRRPRSYQQAAQIIDDYERAHLAPSPAGIELTRALVAAIAERLPRPIRPLVPALFAQDLRSPLVAHALGLENAPHRHIATVLTKVRVTIDRVRTRHTRPSDLPNFEPGQPIPGYFPAGYTVKDFA
ncbi:MAG: DUF2236 domain-containing protein [Actinomycetota bacterium]|nr:DUF2236 domain-containing protein [Actinomycetota bacterium]